MSLPRLHAGCDTPYWLQLALKTSLLSLSLCLPGSSSFVIGRVSQFRLLKLRRRPMILQQGKPYASILSTKGPPSLQSSQPFKYLGVRVWLNGDMSHERNYILTRTAELVAKLRGHRYTPSQMHRVVTTTVVSVFRYSAPWVDYSANDLERVALLWRRGFRLAWRLGRSTASAVF